ncbi:hypothetical protein NERG_01293 [Nematocida ausubeli]|uniref:U3 small nucleolar RNA-associated protein 10 n=1 Tax=Nematocida ausubeli (strain ATCC PRA-371 / ERTm2) TaxID=1913371 RepID=H8ZC50_NEMA1|nr:hypothetical protein NERG_01293 [Nematocida ausubeli]
MSIAEQLNKVREKNVKERSRVVIFREWIEEPDILFYSRVEEAVELFQLYHDAAYERAQKYITSFTDDQSQNSRRDRMTDRENALLSKRMKLLLETLTPYTLHEYVQVILEWLIRRYRIDKYEFDYLVSATIQVPSIHSAIEMFTRRNPFMNSAVVSLLQCRCIPQLIGKDLAKNTLINVCILKPLLHIEGNKDTAAYAHFLEKVSESLFVESGIPEEVVCEWVNSLMDCRRRMKTQASKESQEIVKRLESILIYIRANHELIDEIEAQIDEFSDAPALPTEAVVDSENVLYRFSTLYAHFKETAEKDEIMQEYPIEFMSQLVSEKEEVPGWLDIIKDTIFTMPEQEGIMDFLLEKTGIATLLSTDARYKSLAKKNPAIDVLARIEREAEGAELKITKPALKSFYGILPNRRIEAWIFKKVSKYSELKTVLSVLLPVLSLETIHAEMLKVNDWASAVLFLDEAHVDSFVKNISRDLLVSHFSEYIDAVSKYANYTPLGLSLSSEEKASLLEITRNSLKRNMTPADMLFMVHLYVDLGAQIEDLLALHEKISLFPEEERKRPVKALLSVLSTMRGDISSTVLRGIIRSLDAFDVDTTISLLFYRTALSLSVSEFGAFIAESILKADESESVEGKMLRCLRKDNVDLVSAVFEKYFTSLTPQEIMHVITTEYIDLLAAGLTKAFIHFDLSFQQDIIRLSMEMEESGRSALFDIISKNAPYAILLQSVIPNSKHSITLVLDTVLSAFIDADSSASLLAQNAEGAALEALLLEKLIQARKMGINESVLCNWERTILPMPNIPALLAQLVKKAPSQIVRGIISRYLKKNLCPTVLLFVFVQNQISDSAILSNILKYNPSPRSKVLLLRSVLMKPLKNTLPLVFTILQDKKSSLLRYYIQSRLKHIVKCVLAQKDTQGLLVTKIMCNLISREKNVMHPYVPSLMSLVKKTKKKMLVRKLSNINLRYIMEVVSDNTDMLILKEYIQNKLSDLEPEDVKALTSFYINRIDSRIAAKTLVTLFEVIKNPQEVWTEILKKTEGYTPRFINILHCMSKSDTQGICMASLSSIYSRLESMLIAALEENTTSEIVYIMKKFFMHEKSTLITISRILELSLLIISNHKSIPGLISALFYSQAVNNPSEAEGINHAVLVELTKAEGNRKTALFNTLYKMYAKYPDFITRILGQSAPYFAILLESKDASTRKKAEHLMKCITSLSGEDPYKFL